MKKKRCQLVKMSTEAKVLKALRIQNNLSMREAGFRIGKSDSYISHLENGRMNIPEGLQRNKLLSLYNINADEFQKRVHSYKERTPKIEILTFLLQKLDEKNINLLLSITEKLLNPQQKGN